MANKTTVATNETACAEDMSELLNTCDGGDREPISMSATE
jgi:hypothetical protein